MRVLTTLLLASAAFMAPSSAVVVLRPPINDGSSSTILLGERQGGYTNQGGSICTAEPSEPPVRGLPAKDTIWYKYTARETGKFVVTIPVQQGLRAELRYPGVPELTLPLHTFVDGTSNTISVGEERIEADLGRGQTVYLVVDSPNPFSFQWRFASVANDDYRDAQFIPFSDGTVRQLNLGATQSAEETALGCPGPTIWYSWIAPSTNIFAADLVGSRQEGTLNYAGYTLRVYNNANGIPGSLLVSGSGSSDTNETLCAFGATQGQTYWFACSGPSAANHNIWFSVYLTGSEGVYTWADGDTRVGESQAVSSRLLRLRGYQAPAAVSVKGFNESAMGGEDFDASSLVLTFPAGVRSRVVSLPTFADGSDEAPEILTVQVAEKGEGLPLLVTIADANAAQAAVGWGVREIRVREGDIAHVELRRTNQNTSFISLPYTTQNVNGAVGVIDYTPTSGTAYIDGDASYTTINIPTVDDSEYEPEESFAVYATLPAYSGTFTGAQEYVRVIIEDDDHWIAQAGRYCGIVDTDGWGALVKFTLSASGAATGTVDYKGGRYAFRGSFDGRGRLYANLPRTGQLPALLQLSFGQGWEKVHCSFRDPRPAYGDRVTQTLLGDGSVRTISGDGTVRLVPYDGRTRVAPQAGAYTVAGLGPVSSALNPFILTGTALGDGSVRFVGRMADNTPVSTSSMLTAIDTSRGTGSLAPFNINLYGAKGSLYGELDLGAGPQFPGTSTYQSWHKPWRPADRYYPALPFLETEALCRRYVPPARGDRALGSLDATGGNGRLTFEGGGTIADGTSNTLILGENNLVQFPSNPNACVLRLNPATGACTGSIRPPGQTIPLPFYGVLDQVAGYGVGFYLGDKRAGTVRLLPPLE